MNVDFADEEMIAYRESLIEKKKEQPFWKKKCLSVNETAAYTGIGRVLLSFGGEGWIEIKKIDEINSYRNLITQGGLNNPP